MRLPLCWQVNHAEDAKMATKKPTAKSVEKPAAIVEPTIDLVQDNDTDAAPEQLRIKELLDRVAIATDLNKNKVRTIVEATLTELGKALQAGEGVNLPQLGKIRIVNSRSEDQGTVMTLKLRRMAAKPAGEATGKEALAEVGEDS
jgi:nucleoid DNA-binding protein